MIFLCVGQMYSGAHGGGHGCLGACRRVAAALCSVPAATSRPCPPGQRVTWRDERTNVGGASISLQRTLNCNQLLRSLVCTPFVKMQNQHCSLLEIDSSFKPLVLLKRRGC